MSDVHFLFSQSLSNLERAFFDLGRRLGEQRARALREAEPPREAREPKVRKVKAKGPRQRRFRHEETPVVEAAPKQAVAPIVRKKKDAAELAAEAAAAPVPKAELSSHDLLEQMRANLFAPSPKVEPVPAPELVVVRDEPASGGEPG
jgi:hypothetical protein